MLCTALIFGSQKNKSMPPFPPAPLSYGLARGLNVMTCGGLELSPLRWLEQGSAARSPPPVLGPGCTDLNFSAFIFKLNPVPVPAVACPRMHTLFCVKGNILSSG